MSPFSIFCQNFFVSQCRKISYVNPSVLCVFQKNFGCERMDERGGSIKIFCRNFWSHSAEDIRRVTLQCFTTFGCRKCLDKRGGGKYQDFLSKIFFLTGPKNFVGEPFCAVFQKISGGEKRNG